MISFQMGEGKYVTDAETKDMGIYERYMDALKAKSRAMTAASFLWCDWAGRQPKTQEAD